jgi:hypothetical protein
MGFSTQSMRNSRDLDGSWVVACDHRSWYGAPKELVLVIAGHHKAVMSLKHSWPSPVTGRTNVNVYSIVYKAVNK